MIEFKWLRRRDGKRIIAVSNETAEPPDQIDELIRIVGEDQSGAGRSLPGAKKAQPAGRRDQRRRQSAIMLPATAASDSAKVKIERSASRGRPAPAAENPPALIARQSVDLLVPACSEGAERSWLREVTAPVSRGLTQRERNAVKTTPSQLELEPPGRIGVKLAVKVA